MTKYTEKSTRVRESIANRISHGRGKVKIRLAKKDGLEGLVLTLTNVFYLPNSSSNLVSFGLLNDAEIYHHNKDQTIYNQSTQKTFTFAKKYKTSFFLYLLNLSSVASYQSSQKSRNLSKTKSEPNVKQKAATYPMSSKTWPSQLHHIEKTSHVSQY